MTQDPTTTIGDAFGEALLAHHRGEDGTHVIVRDDGHRHVADAARYFGGIEAWSPAEARAFESASGRLLDVGSGAGRVALEARARGLEVQAIDTSPGAVAVCHARGLDAAVVATVDDLSASDRWDTITLFGSNLGLMRDPDEAPRLLGELRRRATDGALLLGSSRDPRHTDKPAHLDYHRANLERGRMLGQVTIRVEYRDMATPWFDYLYVSPDELRTVIADTGWALIGTLDEGEPFWVAILRAV